MRRLLSLCLVILPLLGWAQEGRPEWYDANTRGLMYPDAEYFVGFAAGFAHQGESMERAVGRVKTEAQGDAAQRIEVHVTNTTLDAVQSHQKSNRMEFDEEINTLFQRETTTHADIEIPNLQTKVWSDSKSREVVVMVYTRRRDFLRYYDRQIESLLGKMEVALENVLQQEQLGSKIKGRSIAKETLLMCPEVEYAQRMVALSDPDATMDDLQMPRYTTLVKQLVDAVNRLRHATAFFIECNASIGDKPYNLLDKEVRGQLAAQGCHFTDDRQAADWVVSIDAEVIGTSHKEGMAYFAFVDGTLTIHNGKTGKKVHDDRLSTLEKDNHDGIKGGDFDPDKAARMAYRNAAQMITHAILKLVQE